MNPPEREDEEPLVLLSMQCSYKDLVNTIEKIDFGGRDAAEHCRLLLPIDLSRSVADYFTVKPVQQDQITVSDVSSQHDDVPHERQNLLSDDDPHAFWESRYGSMPGGRGEEYLQFDLNNIRRVSAISIGIPQPQDYPVSVRDFRIDYRLHDDGDDEWILGRQLFTVDEIRSGSLQRFALKEPFDAKHVRIVCLSNQISATEGDNVVAWPYVYETQESVIVLQSIDLVLFSYVLFE